MAHGLTRRKAYSSLCVSPLHAAYSSCRYPPFRSSPYGNPNNASSPAHRLPPPSSPYGTPKLGMSRSPVFASPLVADPVSFSALDLDPGAPQVGVWVWTWTWT